MTKIISKSKVDLVSLNAHNRHQQHEHNILHVNSKPKKETMTLFTPLKIESVDKHICNCVKIYFDT